MDIHAEAKNLPGVYNLFVNDHNEVGNVVAEVCAKSELVYFWSFIFLFVSSDIY